MYVWLLWTQIDGRWMLDEVHCDANKAMAAGRRAYLRRTGLGTLGAMRWHKCSEYVWERSLGMGLQKIERWSTHP